MSLASFRIVYDLVMGLVLKNSLCADKQSRMVQIYCVESPKFGTC